jgi:peptidoglycan-associated lipoprotein
MKASLRRSVFLAAMGAVSVALVGCSTAKKEVKKEVQKPEETSAPQETQEKSGGPASQIIGTDWTTLTRAREVYFDFDKADLGSAALGVLKANAAALKKTPRSVQVIVEGYCDERGTIEYNVALGQRRANAVKDYYAHAGVNRSRIQTISYGKERPVCSDATEECWARNRRGVTKVRSDEPVTVNFQ